MREVFCTCKLTQRVLSLFGYFVKRGLQQFSTDLDGNDVIGMFQVITLNSAIIFFSLIQPSILETMGH